MSGGEYSDMLPVPSSHRLADNPRLDWIEGTTREGDKTGEVLRLVVDAKPSLASKFWVTVVALWSQPRQGFRGSLFGLSAEV